MQIKLPGADIEIFENHFEENQAHALLKSLESSIPWHQNNITCCGKESLVPRLESWH